MKTSKSNVVSMQNLDDLPLTKNQKSLIGMVVLVSILEFFDLFLIGFIIAILIQDQHWILSSFKTSFIFCAAGVGTMIGSIIFGYLADQNGRKKAFILCIIIVVTFTGLSALTPVNNWIFLFLMRILVGIGVGGLNIISIPYIQEFMPIKKRGLFTGFSSTFIPFGLILGSLATRYLSSALGWRGLLLLGCLPIFLLIWIKKIPESPRYLISKGRLKEAKKSYAWAMNISINTVDDFPEDILKTKDSYLKIISSYSRPLIIVSIGTFCFTFGSFILQSWGQILLSKFFGFNITHVANLFLILAIGNLAGRLLSAWISDYIGRRWTLFIFGFFGAIGCMIAAFSLSFDTMPWIFFIGIFFVMMFGDGAFGIINVFGGEMFPNKIRATCLGLGYGVGAVSKIIGPIFFGLLNDDIKLNHNKFFISFFIFSFIFLLGGIIYLFAKETNYLKLEDI